jgi:hypothetical protein
MLRAMQRSIVLVLLVACGGGTPKEPTITTEQQTTLCRPSVEKLVDLIARGDTGGVPLAARIRTNLLARCIDDKWGQDALDCFRRLETIEQAEGCAKYLTIPQRDGFQQAIESAAQ